MPSFIIVGYVWQILGRGLPPIREQPRKGPSWIGLKNNQHDASVSNIILRTDNSKLNATYREVNQILSELRHEKNIYLIDYPKKIKPNHPNKGKLHLNKNDSNILSRTFVNEISRVFNWQIADNNSRINIEGVTLVYYMTIIKWVIVIIF